MPSFAQYSYRPDSSIHGARLAAALLFLAAMLLLSACDFSSPTGRDQQQGIIELEVWMHSGNPDERRAIQEQVARFNNLQYRVRVNAVLLPEDSYEVQVREAARTGKLPDMLDFNGPFVHDHIQRGHLIPLDKLLTDNSRLDLLPSVIGQGMFEGRIYTIATQDSALGIYVRPSRLKQAGIRIPAAVNDAWSAEEFGQILSRLAGHDPDGAVLDLGLSAKGEWYTHSLLPVIHSAGGDLIDRASYKTAHGRLNTQEVAAALTRMQSWINGGYVDMDPDRSAFLHGRVALSLGSQKDYHRYAEAVNGDLALVPLPDFGHGPRTAQGGWGWAVTSRCRNRQAAMQFLEYLLQPEQVLAAAEAGEGIPATRSAIARSPLYRNGGPMQLFVHQLETIAVSRPNIPSYPAISAEFQRAVDNIVQGGDVARALDDAVAAINGILDGDA